MSQRRAAWRSHVRTGDTLVARGAAGWSLAGLAGRLVELSGAGDSAALTLACGLVREAQRLGEPAAWATLRAEAFFPPDVAAGGVDLAALPVVRAATVRALCRAADRLARSGAFGLLVCDLGGDLAVPLPVQSRLLGLAQRHDLALLFLTRKPERAPSLGSLVSLRAHTVRRRTGPDEFTCELFVVKDKRHAPGWRNAEVCRGPAGLH